MRRVKRTVLTLFCVHINIYISVNILCYILLMNTLKQLLSTTVGSENRYAAVA